jgi:RND superfamily putative drug exporter
VRSLATWCVRHRRTVVIVWLLVLVLTTAVGKAVGTNYTDSFTLPGTESTKAFDLLKAANPGVAGDVDQIVIATSHNALLTDVAVQSAVTKMLKKIAAINHVHLIQTPFVDGVFSAKGVEVRSNPSQMNADHTVGYVSVTLDILGHSATESFAKNFVSVAQSAQSQNLQVAISGQLAQKSNKQSFGLGTELGALAALVVLLLVFGSLFAALMPLMSALVGLGTATALIGMLTHVLKMPMFAPILVVLIGLGVGVDYALFIVTRHRQGLLEGMTPEESIVKAVNTSGRAVLFAGIIVCIALLGMFALGVSFLYGVAIAASIGVAFTMIAALTLLPAVLGFVGPKILSLRQRQALAASGPRDPANVVVNFWGRWSNFIDRRPSLPAVVAVGLIVLIALPFFSIRLGSADEGNDPVGTTTRTAYDLLAKGFGPGFNGPLQIVAKLNTPSDLTALNALETKVAHTNDVAYVSPPLILGKAGLPGAPFVPGEVALINVVPKSAPQDAATTHLISVLRGGAIPAASRASSATILLGGVTAIFIDFAHVLGSKLPLFIGLVVLLSFLLLALIFRSLLVPLMSAVMNLFSIGAAFGVLVAVFQWGWLGSIFGVSRTGPVEAFLPVMLFAILFGLSMDYQVFLLARMHEEWLKSGDNRTAVRLGLARTGKTITAAAAIMIVVFGSFILGGERIIKEFGLGLAGGVLIDAVIIRMAIVPAIMFLFGRANWWFPKWLDQRLPKFGLEHD